MKTGLPLRLRKGRLIFFYLQKPGPAEEDFHVHPAAWQASGPVQLEQEVCGLTVDVDVGSGGGGTSRTGMNCRSSSVVSRLRATQQVSSFNQVPSALRPLIVWDSPAFR